MTNGHAETTLPALPPPDTEVAPPRTPLLPERSDFLEGDAPAAEKVEAFLARALEATGSEARCTAGALVPWICDVPPLRVGAYQGKGLARTLLGLTAYMPFTPPFNLVGFPAASVPAGTSADGLPLGVQLAAAPGGEALLLALARQLETLRPWPRHAPLEPVPGPARRP